MKNKKSVLNQVGLIIIIMFALIAIVNGMLVYRTSSGLYILMLEAHIGQIMQDTRAGMESYKSLEWLLDYWQDHYKEMYLSGDNVERNNAISKILADRQLNKASDLTINQAKSLSENDQRLFAEFCYLDIAALYSSNSNNFELSSLYCVNMEDKELAFPFFQAKENEDELNSYGNFYALGEWWPFNASLHPAVTEMYETKEDRTYFEQVSSTIDDGQIYLYGYLYGYLPVLNGNDIRCHICACYDMAEIRETLSADLRIIEWVIILMMAIAAMLLFIILNRSLLRRLVRIQKTVRDYRETKDSNAVVKSLETLHSTTEVGILAKDVSDMAVEMERYTDEMAHLYAENERINTELSLAARIQMNMLPTDFPEHQKFDICASMTAAREVGGDFYDFFQLDDDHLALLIADVSGKGIPAALFMMASKIMLKNSVMPGRRPSEVLEQVNEGILANNEGKMFFTVWLGILEISTGRITAANAGHEYPLILHADGSEELIEDDHDFVIGVVKGMKYNDYELKLKPGDRLFVYTDGVPEAANEAEEMFGTDRMLEVMRSIPDATPEQLLKEMEEAVADFQGEAEQFDDITMLCLEYRG